MDPSGEVLLFSQGGCPWKEHLFSLERELEVETTVKFVLYPDQSGNWRIQCVPAGLNTFQNRCYFLPSSSYVSLIEGSGGTACYGRGLGPKEEKETKIDFVFAKFPI